jgi:hypothetical protein
MLSSNAVKADGSDMSEKSHTSKEVKVKLKAAATRALAEAEARRASQNPAPLPPERGGRNGLEPTRYGDWEKNGVICDF